MNRFVMLYPTVSLAERSLCKNFVTMFKATAVDRLFTITALTYTNMRSVVWPLGFETTGVPGSKVD